VSNVKGWPSSRITMVPLIWYWVKASLPTVHMECGGGQVREDTLHKGHTFRGASQLFVSSHT
jgi:hypothetical protein